MKNNPVFLVDSRYICYRSTYSLINAIVQEVESTMFFGFIKTLLSIAKGLKCKTEGELHPKNIILCWDSKHSYRRLEYPWYKDQSRKKTTPHEDKIREEIQNTFPKLINWMRKIGMVNVVRAGYEADDLFAGYVNEYPDEKFTIISSDSDLYQLLTPNVSMYIFRYKKNSDIFTEKDFVSKYGIEPKDWVTVKAVGGCVSDNISGVKGIGENRAIQFVKGEMTGKYLCDISESSEAILANTELVKLPYLGKVFNDLPMNTVNIDWDAFTRLCQIYSFKSFIVDFGNIKSNFDRIQRGG